MKTYFVKTPRFIASYFKNYTWYKKGVKKEIYLTFDDGPTPEVTVFVLDVLKKYNIKATFFCIGKNIEENPKIFQQIIEQGHAIGNHTQDHLNGWRTKKDTYIDNVEVCQKVIELNTKQEVLKLYRPPYGKIKREQAKVLIKQGYEIIMWSVLSADFDTKISKEQCLLNVTKNIRKSKGNIIVFHDSVKAFEKLKHVLPIILALYIKEGYSFKKMY